MPTWAPHSCHWAGERPPGQEGCAEDSTGRQPPSQPGQVGSLPSTVRPTMCKGIQSPEDSGPTNDHSGKAVVSQPPRTRQRLGSPMHGDPRVGRALPWSLPPPVGLLPRLSLVRGWSRGRQRPCASPECSHQREAWPAAFLSLSTPGRQFWRLIRVFLKRSWQTRAPRPQLTSLTIISTFSCFLPPSPWSPPR